MTLDAFFAVIVALSILSIGLYHPFKESTDASSKLDIQRNMNDALYLLDKEGAFKEPINTTKIEADLNSTIKEQYDWKVNITGYTYGGSNIFKQTYFDSLGNTTKDLSKIEVMHGTRLFLTFGNFAITGFYTAEYWVWTKNE